MKSDGKILLKCIKKPVCFAYSQINGETNTINDRHIKQIPPADKTPEYKSLNSTPDPQTTCPLPTNRFFICERKVL